MVRVETHDVPRRKQELLAAGVQDYDLADRLAREFEIDKNVMELCLFELMKRRTTNCNN